MSLQTSHDQWKTAHPDAYQSDPYDEPTNVANIVGGEVLEAEWVPCADGRDHLHSEISIKFHLVDDPLECLIDQLRECMERLEKRRK